MLVLFLVQYLCSSGPQKEWKRTLFLCSTGAVSVLLWCSLSAPLVLRRSGRGHGPQKEQKRTRSSEGVEEDTVLRKSGRGYGVGSVPGAVSVLLWFSKEWKRTRCWFCSWCSLCAPLVLKGVEDDTVLVLFLVQSLCSSGTQKEWKMTRCWFCSWFSISAPPGPQEEWKRTRCWFCSWFSLCAPLVLRRSGRGHGVGSVPGSVSVLPWSSEVEEDTVLVLFLVQSLCSLWSSEGDERLGLDRNKLGRLVPAFQRSKQVH